MFWFCNKRSGKYKLINKVDNLILFLAKKFGANVREFVCSNEICNVNDVFKIQTLPFMHDICNNKLHLPFFPIVTNIVIHEHNTRSANNLHVNFVSTVYSRNFVYNSILTWNSCININRTLPKYAFLNHCKCLMFT
jgi:hypothetical protein